MASSSAVDSLRGAESTAGQQGPGGRLALADVIAENEAEPGDIVDAASWVDCLSGALIEERYRDALATAGFAHVSIQRSHAVTAGFTSVIVWAASPGSQPG